MKNMKGFTVIDLISFMVIIGILSAIALPAYKDYIAQVKAESLADSLLIEEGSYYFENSCKAREMVYNYEHRACIDGDGIMYNPIIDGAGL